MKRRWIEPLLVALSWGMVAAAGCGSGVRGTTGTGGNGGQNPDGSAATASCLDQPDQLFRPPSGRLPCELIPPGLRL